MYFTVVAIYSIVICIKQKNQDYKNVFKNVIIV